MMAVAVINTRKFVREWIVCILTSLDSITDIIVSKFVKIPIAVMALSSDSSESSRFLKVMA
jgi:hypothetical protein